MTAPIYRPTKIDRVDEFNNLWMRDEIKKLIDQGFSCSHIAYLLTTARIRYTQRGVLEYCKRNGLIKPIDTRQSIKWRTKTGRQR